MKEDFIQYVWKFRLFNQLNLKTSSGKNIKIIHTGHQNVASGPDFSNAKIEIDAQLWAGNVEIHLNQNDWNLHRHFSDAAYNNVILHVVYHHSNLEVKTQNNRNLETLFIKDLIYKDTLENYNSLLAAPSKSFVPCEHLVAIDEALLLSYYDRLLTERLQRKVKTIEEDVARCQGDLDKAFLISLFKYFGAPQNKEPFEMLALNMSINTLIKQAVSKENLEALLFGFAGFLVHEVDDEYKEKLENEFEYFRQLYRIDTIMDYSQWKFAGVRPPNFPTIRIAQLAAVLYAEQRWFSYIQNEDDLQKIKEKLKVMPSTYWKTHFNFGKCSKESNKQTSDAFLDKIMINVVVPYLFYYGKFVQEEKYIDRAFDLLLSIKAEQNSITKAWKNIGFPNRNAFDSQALISLKQDYCEQKKCLECAIGYKILKQ